MEAPIPLSNRIFKLVNPNQPQLFNINILIVGVGGIGCEILKVLSKIPIGTVHIIDMDTIQLSNLNRQFLFKKEHKGMSKALIARQTILKLNPEFNVIAHHKNIKQLPINFFKQFNFLVMALDNIDARNYVNKIGVRLNIPIIDAGTLGYKGNVSTIIPRQTRCYSCQPKSTEQKVFPVCTIRMRPEKPIHCIVWAKLLFQVLFGPQNDDNDLKDLSELAKKNDIIDIMTKLFESDILLIKNAKEDSDNKLSEIFAKSIRTIPRDIIQKNLGRISLQTFSKHDNTLSLQQTISIFSQSFNRLNEQKEKQSIITFQKDDDNIIYFISSAANLRMYCFSINEQSFNEVKNMAGNIVPAIASTNSIVSGIQVVEMMKMINHKKDKMKSYFVQNLNTKVIGLRTEKSLDNCQVCHPDSIPVIISTNLSNFTLHQFVNLIKDKSPKLQEFSINYGSKQFFNTEDPRQSLLQKSILQLCSAYQVDLVITNQDTMKKVCVVWLVHEEDTTQPRIQNEDQLQINDNQENNQIREQKDQQYKTPSPDDDDIVLFADEQADQLDIEIIEVRKNPDESKNLNQIKDTNLHAIEDLQIQERNNVEQDVQIIDDYDKKQSQGQKKEGIVLIQQQTPGNEQFQVEKRLTSPMAQQEHSSDSIKKKVKGNDDNQEES